MKVCCETYHATTRYILYIFSVKQVYTSRIFFPKKSNNSSRNFFNHIWWKYNRSVNVRWNHAVLWQWRLYTMNFLYNRIYLNTLNYNVKRVFLNKKTFILNLTYLHKIGNFPLSSAGSASFSNKKSIRVIARVEEINFYWKESCWQKYKKLKCVKNLEEENLSFTPAIFFPYLLHDQHNTSHHHCTTIIVINIRI